LEELRRLLASVVVLEFALQAVCWRSCASVGNGDGFGICFTGCLLEELRRLLATVGFWNLLHRLFVGGVARLLATVVVLEFASQAVCWRSCASVGNGGGFGICFTGCLLEERLRNEVGF